MPGRAARNVEAVAGVENLSQVLRALSKIDKDLQADVRDASAKIAAAELAAAQRAATTPLQRLAAGALTVRRDRIPSIFAGTRTVRPGTRLTDVFYGAEFGGGGRPTTRQFPPHRGRRGYFLYPTLRANSGRYFDMWAAAVDDAFAAWSDRVVLKGLSDG